RSDRSLSWRLPARFGHARDLTSEGQLTKTDATQREAADECARPSAQSAAIMRLHFEARRTIRLGDHGFLGQLGLLCEVQHPAGVAFQHGEQTIDENAESYG